FVDAVPDSGPRQLHDDVRCAGGEADAVHGVVEADGFVDGRGHTGPSLLRDQLTTTVGRFGWCVKTERCEDGGMTSGRLYGGRAGEERQADRRAQLIEAGLDLLGAADGEPTLS